MLYAVVLRRRVEQPGSHAGGTWRFELLLADRDERCENQLPW
ncbi:MAG: hypothetical protein RLY14_2948 [Planctomycetota bacterium]|jgi:hypothetical protein